MNHIRNNTIVNICKNKISNYQVSEEAKEFIRNEINRILNNVLLEALDLFKKDNALKKEYGLKPSKRIEVDIFRKAFKQINEITFKGRKGQSNSDTFLSSEADTIEVC